MWFIPLFGYGPAEALTLRAGDDLKTRDEARCIPGGNPHRAARVAGGPFFGAAADTDPGGGDAYERGGVQGCAKQARLQKGNASIPRGLAVPSEDRGKVLALPGSQGEPHADRPRPPNGIRGIREH